MRLLKTVILEHITREGCHYDWLMEDPTAGPQALLWTARVQLAPEKWRTGHQQILTPINPHRRAYLTYQGPISQDRGSVKRVAQGRFLAPLWTPAQRLLNIHWQEQTPLCPHQKMQVQIHLSQTTGSFVPTWE